MWRPSCWRQNPHTTALRDPEAWEEDKRHFLSATNGALSAPNTPHTLSQLLITEAPIREYDSHSIHRGADTHRVARQRWRPSNQHHSPPSWEKGIHQTVPHTAWWPSGRHQSMNQRLQPLKSGEGQTDTKQEAAKDYRTDKREVCLCLPNFHFSALG